jgi:hypothetical protein
MKDEKEDVNIKDENTDEEDEGNDEDEDDYTDVEMDMKKIMMRKSRMEEDEDVTKWRMMRIKTRRLEKMKT